MKYLSLTVFAFGLLVALAGFAGRFIGTPDVHLLGQAFNASTFVLVANTILLAAIFMHLLGQK